MIPWPSVYSLLAFLGPVKLKRHQSSRVKFSPSCVQSGVVLEEISSKAAFCFLSGNSFPSFTGYIYSMLSESKST